MNKTVSNKKLICMNLDFYAMKNVLINNNKAVDYWCGSDSNILIVIW